MYFILKYINYQEFKKQPVTEVKPPSTLQIGHRQKSVESRKFSGTRSIKSRSRSLSAGKPSITPSTTVDILNESTAPPVVMVENKEVLINPDCYLGSILDYICEVAGLPRTLNFTMCTTSAEQMNVNDAPLSVPGLEFFVPKETYYIILKEYDHFGNEKFHPLLHKNSEAYSFFMSKFSNHSMERSTEGPRKESSASSTSNIRAKSKEIQKPKGRIKSAATSKEGKSHNTTLPPIKQKNI